MSVEKFVQNIEYQYASTVIDLLTKQFEELQLKKERETPAIQLMNGMAKGGTDTIKEILEILYESKKDFQVATVKNNQSTAIISFALGENGLVLQDAYFDGMNNTEYSEKNPAHNLCKKVFGEITEVV